MAKWVYMFTEGDASMRNTLGGKGANLAEMTKLGLPVPQGFTITTDACTQYYEDGRQINDEMKSHPWKENQQTPLRSYQSYRRNTLPREMKCA